MNVYPYFSIEKEDLPTQWAKMLRRFPQHAHKIRLTETGWPSEGEWVVRHVAGINHPTRPPVVHLTHLHDAFRPIPPAGSPNFANITATHTQADAYYRVYLDWACEQASQGAPSVAETFYYAYFDGRAPPKAPDYES